MTLKMKMRLEKKIMFFVQNVAKSIMKVRSWISPVDMVKRVLLELKKRSERGLKMRTNVLVVTLVI